MYSVTTNLVPVNLEFDRSGAVATVTLAGFQRRYQIGKVIRFDMSTGRTYSAIVGGKCLGTFPRQCDAVAALKVESF